MIWAVTNKVSDELKDVHSQPFKITTRLDYVNER